MKNDERAIMGARNNADLYEAVFTSQGLSFERLEYAFVGKDQPPPYYANLTVLKPSHANDILLKAKELAHMFDGKVGLKDSFCDLKLEAHGFRVLFSSSWIWREARGAASSSPWQKIENEADLYLWEDVWKECGSPTEHHMFPPEILRRPDIHIFGNKVDGRFEAGCIANTSSDCVGLSNVFSKTSSNRIFADAAVAAEGVDPEKPIVGYESGESLTHAQNTGFATVGDLRILIADAAFT